MWIELETPGADIVGFEHPAKSDADKAAIEEARTRRSDPVGLFGMPSQASCALETVTVSPVSYVASAWTMGARPRTVFGLLVSEAGLLTLAGVALGTGLLYLLLAALRPAIDARFGLHPAIEAPSSGEAILLVAIVAAGCLAGFLPAWRAYRRSLADGMTIRL